MPKITLDMNAFKALASDTRLDILKALDGKKLSLKDISKLTKLNKATLHEHLNKLNEAGLVKRKERDGHKWVYYKLTWKGEGLLHPENNRIVVLFSISFFSLLFATILIVSFMQPITVGIAETTGDTTYLYINENNAFPILPNRDISFNYAGNINATNQTVEDLTIQIQKTGRLKNSIGFDYSYEEITWKTKDNIDIKESQNLVYRAPLNFYNSYNDSKNNSNLSKNSNITLGNSLDYLHFSIQPAVNDLKAIVQDKSLLYLGIIFIMLFSSLFIYSSHRYIKSRKPIL